MLETLKLPDLTKHSWVHKQYLLINILRAYIQKRSTPHCIWGALPLVLCHCVLKILVLLPHELVVAVVLHESLELVTA